MFFNENVACKSKSFPARLDNDRATFKNFLVRLDCSAEVISKLGSYYAHNPQINTSLEKAEEALYRANAVLNSNVEVTCQNSKAAHCRNCLEVDDRCMLPHPEDGYEAKAVSTATKALIMLPTPKEFIQLIKQYVHEVNSERKPEWAREDLLFARIDQGKEIMRNESKKRYCILSNAITSLERCERQNIMLSCSIFHNDCQEMQQNLLSLTFSTCMKSKPEHRQQVVNKQNTRRTVLKEQMHIMLEVAWEAKKKMMYEASDYLTALKLIEQDDFYKAKKLAKLRKQEKKANKYEQLNNTQPTIPSLGVKYSTRPRLEESSNTNSSALINTTEALTPPAVLSSPLLFSHAPSFPDNHHLNHDAQRNSHRSSASREVIEIQDPNKRKMENIHLKRQKEYTKLPMLMSTEEFKPK